MRSRCLEVAGGACCAELNHIWTGETAMGSYVEENLGKDETINYSASVSLWKYWFSLLIGACLAIGALLGLAASLTSHSGGGILGPKFEAILLLIALGIIAWPLIARRSTELVITSKRLIAKFGVTSTQSIEIRFDRIETVRVKQSLMGRILNYGDIVVTGTGSTFDPIPNISKPMKFRAALNEAMEATRPAPGSPRL
jgi:uncharacterized membrane protein YdbT with pleckstrin-like domain